MSGNQLDAFLKGGNPEGSDAPPSEAPAAPSPAATPSQEGTERKPDAAAAPNGKTPPATAKAPAPPEPEDDADPGEAEPGQPVVPRGAYEKERARRQNWVERASRAEAERDALTKQLEEARKAPTQAAPPSRQFEPIDPARDPEGYTRNLRGVVLNERLNVSEMMAVDKHGKDVIEQETKYFQERAAADPRLFAELYSKPHPYQWMIDTNQTARLHEEIGNDPAAYRAKVVAEERAKWEGEQRGPAISPAAGLPPSLANARSAAPRGTNGFAGPQSLEDILRRPERKR
jgi:hypothetical protein